MDILINITIAAVSAYAGYQAAVIRGRFSEYGDLPWNLERFTPANRRIAKWDRDHPDNHPANQDSSQHVVSYATCEPLKFSPNGKLLNIPAMPVKP